MYNQITNNMREIKFRAWDGFRKRMITNSVYEYASFDKDGSINCFNPFGKTVLMQYTGLKDKNGKEIYEGDIIKQGSETYEVYYGVQEVDAFEGIGFNLWSFYGDEADGTRLQSTIEIIGNIYENPELLK